MKRRLDIDINLTPVTSTQVNKALKALGLKERLTRGRGYWYFTEGNSSAWPSSSVPVYRITAGTIGWWLTQWLALASSDSDFRLTYDSNEIVFTHITDSLVVTFQSPVEAIQWFVKMTSEYVVTVDGEQQFFGAIEQAKEFVKAQFVKRGIILGIERRTK